MQQKISTTENAIALLTRQTEQDMIVQLINLKKMKTTNRLSCELSDGQYKIRAYVTDDNIKESCNLAFVKITSYGMLSQHEKPVGIVVHSCQVLALGDQMQGQPVDYLKNGNPGGKVNKENLTSGTTQKDKQKPDDQKMNLSQKKQQYISQNKQQPVTTQPMPYNPIMKTPDRSVHIGQAQPRVQSSNPIISTNNNSDLLSTHNYQKISDLYPDFPNWQILARLVKKNYRQFVSKSGKGKLTKVLNVEFVDAAGMRITGALFGDSAIQYYNALKQDSIYQVSKGQIRQDQYNQSKNKNYSKYTIMFTKQSQFRICQNSQLVPNFQSNMKNLLHISQTRNIGQQYDAVAILLKIHQQVQIPKDNKTLYKQVMEICDPENDLIMEAVVWNRGLKLDHRIQGRTIGLFGFRLNQFNEKLSLNSSYTSEIRVLESHKYRKYQGKIDRENMEVLSEKKQATKQQIEQACKNLKQLQNQLVYLQQGKQIRSTLTLILTLISHKKWYYDSCPYCRKSAQHSNRCGSCQKYVEETIPRYKLNVELSDYCGSIWATGFEELGTKLFADYAEGIKGLVTMDESERHRMFEKRQFQEFTVKLTSKLDRDGFVKHTINRVYDCNIMNRITQNIKRVKNHL